MKKLINSPISRPAMITIHLDNNSPPFLIRMLISMVANWARYGLPLQIFPSGGGNGTRSVVSRHQPDFFHPCLRILHAIAAHRRPRQKAVLVKFFCLPSLSLERSPDASQWHLGPLLGEWQGKSYFRGWTPVGTKPTIELSRSHLQS